MPGLPLSCKVSGLQYNRQTDVELDTGGTITRMTIGKVQVVKNIKKQFFCPFREQWPSG